MTAQLRRALGVDLGARRIGLAISDPRATVASPLRVLTRSASRARDHRALLDAAEEYEAGIIVVGMPRSLDGRLGPAAVAARAEIEELRTAASAVGIEVDEYDERLTTVIAESALHEGRVRRGRRRAVVDQIAAAVMLQGWLDAAPRARR